LETVRWLAGGPIETIAAVGRDVTGTVRGEREVIVASGCTQNGVPFSVRVYFAAGLDWRFPMHEVEVFGREGVVRTLDAERIEVYDGKGRHEERVDTPPGDPVQREVLNWLRSLRGQAVWHPTLKELAHTVTACEALRRALVTGEPARV
jgi:predicted dehydrogenase